jgi:hypothetical protein
MRFDTILASFCIVVLSSCVNRPDPRIGERNRQYSRLGVPLDSEEGAAKLAVLQFLGQQVEGHWPLLVPLSAEEIKKVQHLFSKELIPISTVGFRRRRDPPTYDEKTGRTGVVVYAHRSEVHGNRALVVGGISGSYAVIVKCHLVKESGSWKVERTEEDHYDFF